MGVSPSYKFVAREAARLVGEARDGFAAYPKLLTYFAETSIHQKGKGKALQTVEEHLDDDKFPSLKRQKKTSKTPTNAIVDRIDNSIIREPIDLREDKLQSIEEALLWARGSPPVESYLRTAISYAQQADVRLRQQRRHMLRLLREVGVVEGKVMAKFAGIPENSDVISTFPPAYDLITLHALFVDNRAATKVIDCLVSEGVLNNSKSFWNKLSWRKREVRSLMTQGGVASLFEMALKIPVRATEVDEEDVRSVWAAVPRAALPSFEDTDVGISLEFRHTFQSQADSIIVTKSDVTIYVANDVNDIAVCVAEVDKTELGTKGMIHKDYIKAPGEAIQQMLSLVSANFLSEDELRNLQFLWTHLKMERSLLCPQDANLPSERTPLLPHHIFRGRNYQ